MEDGHSVGERIGPELKSEEEEPNGPSVGADTLPAERSVPALGDQGEEPHRRPSVIDGNSVGERIGLEPESEEEPHGPSVGVDTLLAEQSVPRLENEGEEPHHRPSVVDGSLEQDGNHPIVIAEGGDGRVADPAIQIPEYVNTITAAPQVYTDRWPALFADGKTDIHFDDTNPWSFSNGIKGLIENLIGARVNWWPLSARREALPSGFSRVTWKCVSGPFSQNDEMSH